MRIFLSLLGIVSGFSVLLGAIELANLAKAVGQNGPVLFQQIGAMLLCGLPMIALCVCVAGLAVCGSIDDVARQASAAPADSAQSGDVGASLVTPVGYEWWKDKSHPLGG